MNEASKIHTLTLLIFRWKCAMCNIVSCEIMRALWQGNKGVLFFINRRCAMLIV